MFKNKVLVAMLAISGLLLSATASAQVYVGGTVGKAKWNDDCQDTVQCNTSTNAYKILSGYNIDKNFAVEASYFSLGALKVSGVDMGVNFNGSAKGTGLELAGLYKLAFSDDFGGFAKVGLARTKADARISSPGLFSASDSTTSTQPVFGVGLTYKISKELALRGEFENHRMKIADEKEMVNSFSIGVQYTF